jgi:hypothetical protein
MSKSGNGEIVGIDPAAIEAAFAMPEAQTSFEDAAIPVGMAAPQQIQSEPGLSAIEQFYGSADRITQPDAGYYDEFPLPGQAAQAPTPGPAPAPIPIFEPVVTPAVTPYDTRASMETLGLPNIETFQDGMDFLQNRFVPDPSMFELTDSMDQFEPKQLDYPTFTPYDDTDIRNQLNEMRAAEPFDASQFLTTADLPTYQQFDPTALQDELDGLRTQIGLLGQGTTQGFAQAQPYTPILDFAAR